jgi:serine/threonine-protein kinase SRPK3
MISNNENDNDSEYYFTMNHFQQVDFSRKMTDSNSSKSGSYKKSSDSTYYSGSSSGSSSNSSNSNDSSKSNNSSSKSTESDKSSKSTNSNTDDTIKTESSLDSEEMKIDSSDLFNTKTNGNEFYGEVLKNQYLILKKLGYGSFGSVWMAYDVDNNNLVAIKIVNPQDYKEGMLELQTYKRLNDLDTTYLLTMIECFQVTPIHTKYYEEEYKEKYKKERNHIVIVLPLMACSTFDLLKCDLYEDGLPLEVCKKIIQQTLYGVRELEKHGMTHTDLKPENILVCGLNREAEILLQTIQDINIKNVHQTHLEKLIKDKPSVTASEKWLTSYKLYKEITKTIINFIKNDMRSIKKQMKDCKVASKYIENIRIKICDFNLVLDTNKYIGNKDIQLQTRYYRAPEILIGSGLHQKTDYWSIGCILFELLTGDILFDPDKDKVRSRDVHHLYLIEELMGQIPKSMLSEAKNYKKLYDKKGFLQNVGKKVKRWELSEVMKDNYNNLGFDDNVIKNIVKFINGTLNVIPDNRPNIKTMLLNINTINN